MLAPFVVGIEIRVGRAGKRRVFHGVQNGGIGKFRQSREMIVEGIAIHVRRAHDVGDGDFTILTFGKQFPERVFEPFFGWQNLRISAWTWHGSPFLTVVRKVISNTQRVLLYSLSRTNYTTCRIYGDCRPVRRKPSLRSPTSHHNQHRRTSPAQSASTCAAPSDYGRARPAA